jgi:hypothetical protein
VPINKENPNIGIILMNNSQLTSPSFQGTAILDSVSYDQEKITFWQLLDEEDGSVMYEGSFTDGFVKSKANSAIEVVHFFSDPGNCREYFKGENGTVYALQADTREQDLWYSTTRACLEPSSVINRKFTDKHTGSEITSRKSVAA